jgi:hypothetical protein
VLFHYISNARGSGNLWSEKEMNSTTNPLPTPPFTRWLLLYQKVVMLGSLIPSINKLAGQTFAFHLPKARQCALAIGALAINSIGD